MERRSVLTGICGAVGAIVTPMIQTPAWAAGSLTSDRLVGLPPFWQFTSTDTDGILFGVDVVDADVVWAAGNLGTPGAVVRTVDGGRSWDNVTPPEVADLEFHDVEAFDRNHAVVLAVGLGDKSRILRTSNGGVTWQEAFRNQDPDANYDAIAFFDRTHGLALSDPVRGYFRVISTDDGGRTWCIAPTDGMPPAVDDHRGIEFARATGTSLITTGSTDAWFGTAGLKTFSRVFHTSNRGGSWTVVNAPIPGEPEFGIASLAFRDSEHGLALGGGVLKRNTPSVVAVTNDGGETWSRAGSLASFRTSIASVTTDKQVIAVAVGPGGSDFSTDNGDTWSLFDQVDLRSINCRPHGACWAVGKDGIAAELR